MMVIFLVGLVSMILMRTLRKDYARYSKDEEADDMVFQVFRPHISQFELLIPARSETWAMNMVGSKYMATFSAPHHMQHFSLL